MSRLKKTFYFNRRFVAALKELSRRTRVPMSVYIRRWVEEGLDREVSRDAEV